MWGILIFFPLCKCFMYKKFSVILRNCLSILVCLVHLLRLFAMMWFIGQVYKDYLFIYFFIIIFNVYIYIKSHKW